ncbi:MAG: LysR family transcriptional regulator [Roseibium sp.]|uniref:LysR family transcriptional regulator n=1 Tax=Roseibium sp. TaxID=1936156 RepID=UPI003D9C01B8
MSKTLDRLSLLETFVRIAERGSISGAARDLGLSQASASRHLQELESRFGLQLMRRTTHSLALTQAGLDLLRDARSLLTGWDALRETHSGTDSAVRGPLKVVAPVALGQLYLADIAADFQMAHPEVSLTWDLNDQPIRFAEVGCDCWIRIGRVPDETLVIREIGRVERLVVASPGLLAGFCPVTQDLVSGLPFVALSPFEGGRISLRDTQGRDLAFEPRISMATNNIFAVHRAVLKGAGAAILPRWFVQADLDNGRLTDILPAWRAAELRINAAYLPAGRQPKRLSSFLRCVTDQVALVPGIGASEPR